MGQFASIYEVPQGFRYVGGYPLSLDQINDIIDEAHANSTGPEDFAYHLGQAKKRFMETHTVQDSQWV